MKMWLAGFSFCTQHLEWLCADFCANTECAAIHLRPRSNWNSFVCHAWFLVLIFVFLHFRLTLGLTQIGYITLFTILLLCVCVCVNTSNNILWFISISTGFLLFRFIIYINFSSILFFICMMSHNCVRSSPQIGCWLLICSQQ